MIKNILKLFSIKLLLLTSLCDLAFAENSKFSTVIKGQSQATVTKSALTLGDVAEITTDNPEAQLSLARIQLGNSPAPGKSLELSADKIIQSLKSNGVDLSKVGYLFYPKTQITRAGRNLSETEARAAIESLISAESSDLQIKSLILPHDSLVFTGPSTLRAQLKNQSQNSRIYSLELTNSEAERMNLDIKADIENWRTVPVASRDIAAGSIIEAIDFGLAKLNSEQLAKNIVIDPSQLIGKQIQKNIGQGETFKSPSMQKVFSLKNGSRVQMIFSEGGLEASARGIALQDAEIGDIIEVRNDASKNIVIGRVKDRGTVEVLE
jgi:flagella basal body P-ring formation protein FlgA